MNSASRPPLEDVMSAFAVEDANDRTVLARYLREYPEYAEDLIDLSREIHRTGSHDEELTDQDQVRIAAAWKRFCGATNGSVDPLAALSVAEMRQVAITLGVKRQVLAAFREHRVLVDSVPARFLRRFASAIKSTVAELRQALSDPSSLSPVRAYKSNASPEEGGLVTFEKLLIDAGHSEGERSELMSEDE